MMGRIGWLDIRALFGFGVGLLLSWAVHSVAHGAEMCAPDTNPTVCVIIEMRDNALDEAAKAEGSRRVAVAQIAHEQAYWKGYLQGLDEQAEKGKQADAWWKAYVVGDEAYRHATDEFKAQLAAHLQNVCAWKGALNEPTAQLCAWWKGSGR